MAGALRQAFGVCAGEWSPSDGQVVSLDHGCGAHSEADVEVEPERVDAPVLDEVHDLELEVLTPVAQADDAPSGGDDAGDAAGEGVDDETEVAHPAPEVEPVTDEPAADEPAAEPAGAEVPPEQQVEPEVSPEPPAPEEPAAEPADVDVEPRLAR
ncbi:hypothetical protein GCM10025868_16350 [Angustibacter aerolatus]|uniref:DUF3027 domain-containing protein n=1 Tax=Angustibacter aerolatus TaxID=1162965 RepID=A0ABQ6JDX0_9ACTN|nr:hypothetical protein GCM10025868_16350 [Angustibacter aerolatus]